MEEDKEKTGDSSDYYGCIRQDNEDGEMLSVFVLRKEEHMIVDERMVTFIHSLETENSEIL